MGIHKLFVNRYLLKFINYLNDVKKIFVEITELNGLLSWIFVIYVSTINNRFCFTVVKIVFF